MRHKTGFVFTKNWGTTKKGTKKTYGRAFARSLQDVHKVGKLVELKDEKEAKADSEISKLQKENEELKKKVADLKPKPKAEKPDADKAEPKAKVRSTK